MARVTQARPAGSRTGPTGRRSARGWPPRSSTPGSRCGRTSGPFSTSALHGASSHCSPAAGSRGEDHLLRAAARRRWPTSGGSLGPRVEAHETAIGAKAGTATINVSGSDDSSSLLPIGERQVREFPGTAAVDSIEVRVATLDEILEAPAGQALPAEGRRPGTRARCPEGRGPDARIGRRSPDRVLVRRALRRPAAGRRDRAPDARSRPQAGRASTRSSTRPTAPRSRPTSSSAATEPPRRADPLSQLTGKSLDSCRNDRIRQAGLCDRRRLLRHHRVPELLAEGIAFDCFEMGSPIGGNWRYENDNGLSAAYQLPAHQHLPPDDGLRGIPMPETTRTTRTTSRSPLLRRLRRPFRLPRPDPISRPRCFGRPGRGGAGRSPFETLRQTRARLLRRDGRQRPPLGRPLARARLPGIGQFRRRRRSTCTTTGRPTCSRAGGCSCSGSATPPATSPSNPRGPPRDSPGDATGSLMSRSTSSENPPTSNPRADPGCRCRPAGRFSTDPAALAGRLEGLRPSPARPQGPPRTPDRFLRPVAAARPWRHRGEAEHRPFRGDRVLFIDGTQEVDLVIYCTGYKITFPFFDHELICTRQPVPLYRRVASPDHPGPLLHRPGPAARGDHAAGRGPVRVGRRPARRAIARSRTARRWPGRSRARSSDDEALRRLEAPHDPGRLPPLLADDVARAGTVEGPRRFRLTHPAFVGRVGDRPGPPPCGSRRGPWGIPGSGDGAGPSLLPCHRGPRPRAAGRPAEQVDHPDDRNLQEHEQEKK